MTKKIDSSGSCEKERIRDEIDEQIREYLRKGGRIQVLSRVPPVNIIVPLFGTLFVTAVRLQFSRIDDAGHQHGETRQLFPTLVVKLFGFLADLCLTTSAFFMYGNS